MDEEFIKEIASQLRKPAGELGNEVAQRMNQGNREMNIGTIDLLEIAANEHILEVGMGNGFFVKDVLAKADDLIYTGCDYSEDMIKASEELNKEFIESGRASFIHCEGNHIPVDDNTIDSIFTVNTLYFWDDVEATLSEFKRVIKPGGKLAITIRPASSMKRYPTTKYNFEFFEKEDVQKLLEVNGFEVHKSIQVTEKEEVEIFGNTFAAEYAVVLAGV